LLGDHAAVLGHTLLVKRERLKGQIFTSTEELQLNYFNTQVICWTDSDRESIPLIMWKLIPVKVEPRPSAEKMGEEVPPSYEGDAAGQSSTRTQHAESEQDDFGTIVTEVTTVTTRRRYRVPDA
jgi:hypothetical protein